MIGNMDMSAYTDGLLPEEEDYPEPEKQVLRALRALAGVCNGAADWDGVGFSKIDAQFGHDMATLQYTRGKRLSPKQYLASWKVCAKYSRTQLGPQGYSLPSGEEAQAQAARREQERDEERQREDQDNMDILAASPSQREVVPSAGSGFKHGRIGLRDGLLGIGFPWNKSQVDTMHQLQYKVQGMRLKRPDMAEVKFVETIMGDKKYKYWQAPTEIVEEVVAAFPDFEVTQDVASILQRREAEREQIRQWHAERQRRNQERIVRLKQTLGDLSQPLRDERTLYEHQIVGIHTLVEWDSGLLADQMGLGKTTTAAMIGLAYAKAYGYRCIVTGPNSLRANWVREAGWVGLHIEYYTHNSLPESIPGNYILFADEAHAFQNMSARRTKRFVHLAWEAKACFPMTGTPAKNGRPSNMYPLLLACKHALVYAEDDHGHPDHVKIKELKREFERKFCAARQTEYSKWDITGAAFLDQLYEEVVNTPRGVIRRLKDDCLDLPKKRRQMVPAELSLQDAQAYYQQLDALWEGYEKRVEEKIAAFTMEELPAQVDLATIEWLKSLMRLPEGITPLDIDETNLALELIHENMISEADIEAKRKELSEDLLREFSERTKSGQALVLLGHWRHAGSNAKVASTIAMVKDVMENDEVEAGLAAVKGQVHKQAQVVIFTNFKDTAQRVAEALGGQVLSGDTPDKKRQPMIDAFQSGKIRVMVCLYGAGGVGTTLTKANIVLLMDRPWTPGEAEQAEDRLHRIGQDADVLALWMQLPEEVTTIDVKIDGILQRKQGNIVKMLDGGKVSEESLISNMEVGVLNGETALRLITEAREQRRRTTKEDVA